MSEYSSFSLIPESIPQKDEPEATSRSPLSIPPGVFKKKRHAGSRESTDTQEQGRASRPDKPEIKLPENALQIMEHMEEMRRDIRAHPEKAGQYIPELLRLEALYIKGQDPSTTVCPAEYGRNPGGVESAVIGRHVGGRIYAETDYNEGVVSLLEGVDKSERPGDREKRTNRPARAVGMAREGIKRYVQEHKQDSFESEKELSEYAARLVESGRRETRKKADGGDAVGAVLKVASVKGKRSVGLAFFGEATVYKYSAQRDELFVLPAGRRFEGESSGFGGGDKPGQNCIDFEKGDKLLVHLDNPDNPSRSDSVTEEGVKEAFAQETVLSGARLLTKKGQRSFIFLGG